MNRNKKLIRNCCLIIVILYGMYFFGGYFLSKEECIHDTLRALHANQTKTIMEFKNKNHFETLMTDEEIETYSLIGTKKVGFFYQTASSSSNGEISKNQIIDIIGSWSREMGLTIIVYRNLPEIAKIEVELEDGSEFVLSEWKDNFSGQLFDKDNWLNGKYKVYNSNNELIEVIEY